MSFKDIVKKKVPARLQNAPEFKTFLKLCTQKRFSNVKSCKMFLDQEIATCKAKLKSNKRTSTANTERRSCTRHMQFYSTIKKKIVPYL